MKKIQPAASPDAYVSALDGWRRKRVVALRTAVRSGSQLEEVVKWGHLVYLANGPVLLIRASRRSDDQTRNRAPFGTVRGGAQPNTRRSRGRGKDRCEAAVMTPAADAWFARAAG